MEWKEAVWLGVPESEIRKWNILQGDMNGRFAYYRCDFNIKSEANLEILITANSRYRLWVNGCAVLSGPCKGDRHRQYYEKADISDLLQAGKNVLTVQVLFCDPNAVIHQYDERAPIFAAASLPVGHRLAVEGTVLGAGGESLCNVTTGAAEWKVYLDGSFYLRSDAVTQNFGAVREEIDFNHTPPDWRDISYNDESWACPAAMGSVIPDSFDQNVGLYGALRIRERCIPLLLEEEGSFPFSPGSPWSEGKGRLIVKAGKSYELVLDAEVHTNAYLKYIFEKGAGAGITFTYSEKYSCPGREIRRTDSTLGSLEGLTDKIILNGTRLSYEPFWFRTFRFIRIRIQAGAEDVILYAPQMKKTGYPLTVQSDIHSSDSWVDSLWDICVRTLKNCMAETYMDCPYYEQMQFSMDTRLQALFTYALGSDVQLVKKALEDFHCSMLPDGLIQGKYPSGFPQVISTFSLHYIFMLEEYYRQTCDRETARRYRPDVDAILDYYDRCLGADGLVEHLGYWQFVDWQDAWKENMGVPTAALDGPSTIINLMYAAALKSGAYINEVTGRPETAREYTGRQKSILDRIQALCWDEQKGLYREGPHTEQYTQHAQAWAVLNGMASKEEGKAILKRTLSDPDVLQCSFSTGYELFRAFELTDDYTDTKILMEKWIRLIDLKCTTCPEEPENGRSDCHAWSALPIYEFMRCMAGIRMGRDGWESVLIRPHMEYINELTGSAATPKGIIRFYYNKGQGIYQVSLPSGLKGKLILPDGTVRQLGAACPCGSTPI